MLVTKNEFEVIQPRANLNVGEAGTSQGHGSYARVVSSPLIILNPI